MSFASLPDDVYNVIFATSSLTLYDFGRIAQTCHHLADFFRTNDEIWHIGHQKRFPGLELHECFALEGYDWHKYFAACVLFVPTEVERSLKSFVHLTGQSRMPRRELRRKPITPAVLKNQENASYLHYVHLGSTPLTELKLGSKPFSKVAHAAACSCCVDEDEDDYDDNDSITRKLSVKRRIGNYGIDLLAPGLSRNGASLACVSLCNVGLTAAGLGTLCSALRSAGGRALQVLHLDRNRLSGGMEYLSSLLTVMPVALLTLSRCELNDRDIACLADGWALRAVRNDAAAGDRRQSRSSLPRVLRSHHMERGVLCIDRNALTGACGEALAVLARSTSGLFVYGNRIGGAASVALLEAAAELDSPVRKLGLSAIRAGDRTAAALAAALRARNDSLRVDMRFNLIRDAGAVAIAAALEAVSGHRVHLDHNTIGEHGVAALVEMAAKDPRCVTLTGNPGVSVKFVTESLRSDAAVFGVTTLRPPFDTSVLVRSQMLAIAQLQDGLLPRLKANSPDVTAINLAGCGIGLPGLKYLKAALVGNTHVRHLVLENCDVNDKCVSSLLSILQSAPIEELVLSNSTMDQALINKNVLSDDAVRELCEGLRGNRTLRVLRLRNNDLTDAAAGHVRDLLLAGCALTEVDLSFNLLGAAGVAALVRGAAACPLLRVLPLQFTAAAPEQVSQVAAMMQRRAQGTVVY